MRFASILALALLLAPAASAQANITGTWSFTVNTDAGSGTPTVTFKQQGDSLSGHYSSPLVGEHDFKGTLKDGKISFSFSADLQGQQLTVVYTGTMDGADAMKGSVDLGGMATGTFTGKRQKP
jgi:hypothetical protein